jgi:hypothetical protein
MNKTYLAGKMRGVPHYNFPAFDAAAQALRRTGRHVISPAELDRESGFDEHGEAAPDVRACIRRDVLAVIDHCDTIALLPGWEESKGCAVEVALGKFLGLKFIDAITQKELSI